MNYATEQERLRRLGLVPADLRLPDLLQQRRLLRRRHQRHRSRRGGAAGRGPHHHPEYEHRRRHRRRDHRHHRRPAQPAHRPRQGGRRLPDPGGPGPHRHRQRSERAHVPHRHVLRGRRPERRLLRGHRHPGGHVVPPQAGPGHERGGHGLQLRHHGVRPPAHRAGGQPGHRRQLRDLRRCGRGGGRDRRGDAAQHPPGAGPLSR